MILFVTIIFHLNYQK